ncbi:GntR family transcriptional regulator [Streptosporangium sp. 'caverna']|uniref:GntR family transcriptional regulator n=1 Tax=Streptosporangium sp. 'caverna' TaxID=2202249 RepID=UPI000D7D64C4|nr:GntR family transcriptional regulator [Streptosporangium sp. 'caverna']AWS43645.1 GntR family transcriptional regulator [Streptosporangium sp. 'caverna']
MAKTEAGGTRVDAVWLSLQSDILAGRLRPGERLKFPPLSKRFGLSPSVIREALNRLADQGLVRMQPHQGFQVTPLSAVDLRELVEVRVHVETEVFRRAIEHGDLRWETNIVATHHMLARTPEKDPDDPARTNEAWDEAHSAFHRALLLGCTNKRLLDLATRLRQEFKLYRHLSDSLGDDSERDPAGEHKQLADAAIARDGASAVEQLAAHIAAPADRLLRLAAAGKLPLDTALSGDGIGPSA